MYSMAAKVGGMLCLVEVAEPAGGPGTGSCPSCKGTEFREHGGWIECANDCSFAYSKGGYERVLKEMARNRQSRRRDHHRH